MTLWAFDGATREFKALVIKRLTSTTSSNGQDFTITLLPAGTPAGTYHVGVEIDVAVAATAGLLSLSTNSATGAVPCWPQQSVALEGPLVTPMFARYCDGSAAVELLGVFSGLTGTPTLNIRAVVL